MLQDSRLRTLLVITAIIVGVWWGRDGNLNKPAPAFSLPETDGGQIDLASYSGRPVLLVFWASSCSICQHELPILSRLEPEFRGHGISVLAINVGGESDARDYMNSNDIRLKSLYDPNGAVARAYHVGGIPKLVLIDKNGKIKRSSSGWANERVLRGWMGSAS
jgi:peroxiredoxin